MRKDLTNFMWVFFSILIIMLILLVSVVQDNADLIVAMIFTVGIATALTSGQFYARREGNLPEKRYSWKFAFITFPVALVIGALLLMLFYCIIRVMADPIVASMVMEELFKVPATVYLVFLSILFAIHLVVVRFCFSFGARIWLRQAGREVSA